MGAYAPVGGQEFKAKKTWEHKGQRSEIGNRKSEVRERSDVGADG